MEQKKTAKALLLKGMEVVARKSSDVERSDNWFPPWWPPFSCGGIIHQPKRPEKK